MTPRRCRCCICILIICKNVGVSGSANCHICWLHTYFSPEKSSCAEKQPLPGLFTSKCITKLWCKWEYFGSSQMNHWNGRSNLDLETTNHTDWWIWTCNIPQQNKSWDGARVHLLSWPLPPGRFLCFHHGNNCCHCSLQLETQKSFTLMLSLSLSLLLSLSDWQIYYHWFSLSLITTITLGISFLLNTLVVAPCVWLYL